MMRGIVFAQMTQTTQIFATSHSVNVCPSSERHSRRPEQANAAAKIKKAQQTSKICLTLRQTENAKDYGKH